MDKFLTTQNILFAIVIVGILFKIYDIFKKPQNESDVNQVVTEKNLDTKATILAQTEAEGKAQLLDQQVKTEKEYNTKEFTKMTDRFDKTDDKIEGLGKDVHAMELSLSNQLTKIGTVIEEHLKIH